MRRVRLRYGRFRGESVQRSFRLQSLQVFTGQVPFGYIDDNTVKASIERTLAKLSSGVGTHRYRGQASGEACIHPGCAVDPCHEVLGSEPLGAPYFRGHR